jgi:MtN3 and saliva related transmembrane protein
MAPAFPLPLFCMVSQTVIGLFASGLTTLAAIPQLVKIIKLKKAENISLLWIIILFIGLCGWVYYGILKRDYILLISNSLGALINATLAFFAVLYKKRKDS